MLSLVHSETSGKSRLIIVDAQNFAAPPVATIELPFRVPYGAHGNWVADSELHKRADKLPQDKSIGYDAQLHGA